MTYDDKVEDIRREARNKLDQLANKCKRNSNLLALLDVKEKESFLAYLEDLQNVQDGTFEDYHKNYLLLEKRIKHYVSY